MVQQYKNTLNPGIKLTSSNTSQTVVLINNTSSRGYELAVGGSANGLSAGSFYIYDTNATAPRLLIKSDGQLKLPSYGSGSFTGAETYF